MKRNALFIICLLALILRLGMLFVLQPWDEEVISNKVLIGDSVSYHITALNMVESRSLASVDPWFTPGYFFFLSFIYFIFGIKPWIVLFAQVILDTGIVIITYLIARRISGSEIVSLIAAFLYAISFPSAFYSIRLLSETPFTFVFALAILVFISGLKEGRASAFAMCGFLTALAIYFRVVAILFPAVLILVLLFGTGGFAAKARNIAVLIIVLLVTLFPWQFRNLRCYGQYALTTKGGGNLIVNAEIVRAKVDNISRREAQDRFMKELAPPDATSKPFERSKILQDASLSYMFSHPAETMECQIRGMLKMFLGTGQSGLTYLFGIKTEPSYATETFSEAASKVGGIENRLPGIMLFAKQIIEYIFVLAGAVFMCRRDKRLFLFLIVMIILYFAAITGPVGYSRFRVPVMPFYLVVSAEGICGVLNSITRRRS